MEFVSWKWRNHLTNKNERLSGLTQYHFPAFMEGVLAGRGCNTSEAIEEFLDCQYPLHDASLLQDMALAVTRLRQALEAGERIIVFGDYDCDGITATVILYDYLESCGGDVLYYIPSREEDGYGLCHSALDRIKAAGVAVVVTVDNGISAIEEADYAKQLGLDLIITDHHQPKDTLPDALAVVNPHRADCLYPNKALCGVGLAFKLMCALEGEEELLLERYGDILAIGILADMVSLSGENRLLVKKGLEVLACTQNTGLEALAQAEGLDLVEQRADVVTFGIAPRLNVAGRLGNVDHAVELLLCGDPDRARQLAEELCALTTQRKEIESKIFQEIEQMAAIQPHLFRQRVIILQGEGWHYGVIGIIAARVVERWRKPCIILSRNEEEVRGSARSVEGFSIVEAISACAGILTKYGGHPMAAGLSMVHGVEEEFCRKVWAYACEKHPIMPLHSLQVDAPLALEEVTVENIQRLYRMEPFGIDNPQPVLVVENAILEEIEPTRDGKHLRLVLSQRGIRVNAVLFRVSLRSFPFHKGERVNCALALSVNIYREIARPSLRIEGILPAGKNLTSYFNQMALYESFQRGEPLQEGDFWPEISREEVSVVYRYLRAHSPCDIGLSGLWWRLWDQVTPFQLLVAIDILKELDLIMEQWTDGCRRLVVRPVHNKMDLNDSPTFHKITSMKLVC